MNPTADWAAAVEGLYAEIVRLLADPELPPGVRADLLVAYAALWTALDGMGRRYDMHYDWE